jgi:hypothetical protein
LPHAASLLGTAYQDLLWPFQIGFLGSVAAGLGALVLLERPGRRSELGAAALITYSVGSSGIGLAFLAAAAAMLVTTSELRRRVWVVAAPAALFAIWYLGYGTGEHITATSVLGASRYVADAASGAVAGISGLSENYGTPLLIAVLAWIWIGARRHRGTTRPVLIAAVTGALVFWGLSAVARAHEAAPQSSRYVYVGAVFVMLAALDAWAEIKPTRLTLASVGVLSAAALLGNLSVLRAAERAYRATDTGVQAALGATDIAKPVVSRYFLVSPVGAPQVSAGPYFAAEQALGTPALTLSQLQTAAPGLQVTADDTLERAESIRPAPVPVGSAPCTPAAPTTPVRLTPGSRLVVQTGAQPVTLGARRFSASFPGTPLATLQPHTVSQLRFPADLAPSIPWFVQVTGSQAQACVS